MIAMDYTKEIRPGYKKRIKTGVKTPINRRSGCGPGGAVVCWRLLAFLGAGEARRKGRLRVDGLQGMAGVGNGPAAICGGNSAVFNQLLTTFLVAAMVWRLTVFALCSYWQSRRCWRLFRSPGAGRWWSFSGVVWGGWLLDQ